ncbi:hypothetical protein ACVIGA_000236 [Bradyrhizobium sp. USDA 3240]
MTDVATVTHRPVSDERAFELARRLKDHLTAEEAAIAIMEYATDAIEQERADRTWISPINTVADLVNNLLTLDQALAVYSAYFIDRCRARGLSLSLEHVANGRIKRDASIPPSLVIWSSIDQRLQAGLAATVEPHTVLRVAQASALARRLCQMFDSAGESQRTARARHASAIYQLLDDDEAEQRKCDADPVAYLQACEESASIPRRPLAARHTLSSCARR